MKGCFPENVTSRLVLVSADQSVLSHKHCNTLTVRTFHTVPVGLNKMTFYKQIILAKLSMLVKLIKLNSNLCL